jgi:hypothetical protein
MSYIPNGSDTGELSRLVFRTSWGEEVSSPRVGLTPDYRSSSPRHPHSTLFNITFSVCFAIDNVFQYNHGAHPLATGRHSGKYPRLGYSCLPQLRVITHGAIPPVRARITHSLDFRIEYRFTCFSRLFNFIFLFQSI